jgi:hypothetical protein
MTTTRISCTAALLLLLGSLSPCIAEQTYMECTFDDKAINQPIGTGGPEVGEPTWIEPNISAIVRATPFATPSLELHSTAFAGGNVGFELPQQVTSGLVVVSMDLWLLAPVPDGRYTIAISNQAWESLTDLGFDEEGRFGIADAASTAATVEPYPAERPLAIVLAYDLDAGRYSVWVDGVRLVRDRALSAAPGFRRVVVSLGPDIEPLNSLRIDRIVVTDFISPDLVYFDCNFDDKPINQPIGTGGTAVGEPTWVEPSILATVRAAPFVTPSLEMLCTSAAGGNIGFELAYEPVTSGVVVVSADLWLYGSGPGQSFLMMLFSAAWENLPRAVFNEDGSLTVEDSNGLAATVPSFPTGRSLPLVFALDMDADTYSAWVDGFQVVSNRSHGVSNANLYRVVIASLYATVAGPGLSIDRVLVTGPSSLVGVESPRDWLQGQPVLGPPWPNPSNSVMTMDVVSPSAEIRVEVFDVAGRLIRRLADRAAAGGPGRFSWDGTDEAGRPVAPGVYWLQLRSAEGVATRKVVRM